MKVIAKKQSLICWKPKIKDTNLEIISGEKEQRNKRTTSILIYINIICSGVKMYIFSSEVLMLFFFSPFGAQ